ncbi:CRAL-TRIO domain-containing protein [Tuber borchii]|uniref:Phosphatidylinositol transfer protein SFH5 n=1 Tax=Tuber borchii TaxID=42251 RepID=A0A2T6ZBN4_TUBBO|nr:CRAL-TRIO domain-containing protein [Tuber borchii]
MSNESTTPTALAELHTRIIPILEESATPTKMWGVTLSTDKEDFHTKLILQKFLRGNKNDVAAAEKQFVETIKWRRGYFDADGKVLGTWDEKKFAGLGWITKEKIQSSDQEVVVTWNIYGAAKDFNETFGDVDEFIRWRVTLMERTVDLLELGSAKTPIPENGPDPYKAFQIHDYLQVSFLRSPPAVKAASKKAVDLFQNYYPECLDKKFFVNVPLLMGWMFSAMKMIINKDTFKKLYMLTYGASLAGELNSETVPEEYGGKGVKLSTKGMAIDLDGQLIQPELKEVESGDVGVAVATEAPSEEPAQVKEETEGPKVPEESGVAEEPQGVKESEDTEEQKETVGVGQTNEAGEAIKPATVAAPTTATTPATPTSSAAAPASSLAELPADKPSSPVEHETDVPPPVPAKNSGEQPQK